MHTFETNCGKKQFTFLNDCYWFRIETSTNRCIFGPRFEVNLKSITKLATITDKKFKFTHSFKKAREKRNLNIHT